MDKKAMRDAIGEAFDERAVQLKTYDSTISQVEAYLNDQARYHEGMAAAFERAADYLSSARSNRGLLGGTDS